MILEIVLGMLFGVVAVVAAVRIYWIALLRRYPAPAYADAVHSIKTDDQWQIHLHRRKPANGAGEPVFFMHSLASNHLNFEVPHGFSLVDYLSKAGYDCWTLDSRACRDAAPRRPGLQYAATLDDVLTRDIPTALQYIREITGQPRVHWVGHSMGGMLLYAYDARTGGEGLASAVTLGSPPGFKGYRYMSHGPLLFLNRHAHTLLSAVFRGFAPYYDIWRPTSRLIPINWDNVHPKLRARELFHAAELPLPAIGAQMDQWAAGAPWVMCDGAVDVDGHLPKLKTPLLAIFGGIDPFVSLARADEFFGAIENPDKRMIMLSRANGNSANYSHIELPFAIESETEVFGPILEWLQQHPVTGSPKAPVAVKRRRPKREPVVESVEVPAVPADNVHLSAASAPRGKASAKTFAAKKKPAAGKRAPAPKASRAKPKAR